MKSQQVIIAGLAASGSSAICDLLKEIDSYYVMPTEFRLFTDPDGIQSLESSLTDNWSIYQSDLALKRFYRLAKNLNQCITSPYSGFQWKKEIFGNSFFKHLNAYIANLTDFSYAGVWLGIKTLAVSFRYRLWHKRPFPEFILKKINVSTVLKQEDFVSITRSFIEELTTTALHKHNKNTFIFDEGFSSMNPEKILNYLTDGKMILSIRDPRDVFCESKKWNFIPKTVGQFIKQQRALYLRLEQKALSVDPNKLLIIPFEELIKNYDTVKSTIFSFLNTDLTEHSKQFQFLNPELSIKNIGKWQNHPNTEAMKKITSELLPIYESFISKITQREGV